MAKIFLNEWSEVEVVESREDIKRMIKEKLWDEKMPYKWVDYHFIEVTMIKKHPLWWDVRGEEFVKYKTTKHHIDLYYKRILYIYD